MVIAAMVTSLLIGYALNKTGTEGYVFPFVIASSGYLIGIAIVNRLSPSMKPVSFKSE